MRSYYDIFYRLEGKVWRRTDLLQTQRGDIIRKHNRPGRFEVLKKLDRNTVRCKQITKEVKI